MSDGAPSNPAIFAPAAVETVGLPTGGLLLRSPVPLGPYPDSLGEHLRRWAAEAPDRVFLAEREASGSWRTVTYGETLRLAERVAQALLDRGLGSERPVMILSENGVDNAVLQLASMHVGIPVVPVSPAYSLMSRDHSKLQFVFDTIRPGLVFAADGRRFGVALRALDLRGVEVVAAEGTPAGIPATPFTVLIECEPGPAVATATAGVGPDTVAKILFTSGSTGWPKGVINTQRMLCSNQQAMAQVWPFLERTPPVVVDWLPWHHTFGGNHNFNMVLRNGGTLYVDEGRPVAGGIERTVANLREISPTLYFNVPRGYGALLPHLETDRRLRDSFFRCLDLLFYAAAALPEHLFGGLQLQARAALGRPVVMASGLGATETSPSTILVHFPVDHPGVVGLPLPGIDVKLVPTADKLELRVRGPNVTPGYLGRPDLTERVFDEEGYYCMGDAVKLADPGDPAKGIVFDGRVAEDFKLTTGTWVHVGGVRVGVVEAAAPLLLDAVVTGDGRDYLGILAWPNLDTCREVILEAEGPATGAPDASADDMDRTRSDAETVVASPLVRERIRQALQDRNSLQPGSSSRIARVLLMAEPPSLDANEVTDKGYINQAATLRRRAALVEHLYGEPPPPDVIVL